MLCVVLHTGWRNKNFVILYCVVTSGNFSCAIFFTQISGITKRQQFGFILAPAILSSNCIVKVLPCDLLGIRIVLTVFALYSYCIWIALILYLHCIDIVFRLQCKREVNYFTANWTRGQLCNFLPSKVTILAQT